MKYNKLGNSGLKVSELSLGSWLTFGSTLDVTGVKKLMRAAVDNGINFFDNAEGYARGEAERLMGQALRDFRREDLVVATKIFWGGNGANDTGLSRKRIIEGTRNSLKRAGLEYFDIVFCHRPDPTTPLEETVRAMAHLVDTGMAFYWGTSEWSASTIEEAFKISKALGIVAPTSEQPQYNMLHRQKVEQEYLPLFEKHGLGITSWSPLNSGLLTGKYNNGIPKGSRLDQNDWLRSELTDERLDKVRALTEFAQSIGCKMNQLAIAWCLKNPHVSTVILGAQTTKQLQENLSAVEAKMKLTEEVVAKIDEILGEAA